ncbi:MAG: hypothetical protein AABW67_06580 [Nanoarchaeota archaeon]
MMYQNENHEKIVNMLKNRGPSLPIQIAKSIGTSSLFVSAFLSELAHDKRVKVSSLRVGGSPLYFIQGQEEQLENFHKYLHPKEAEAFLLLKQKKVLKDSEQEPAIRVALRNIKDFAEGFQIEKEIFWKHVFTPDSEINTLLKSKQKIQPLKEIPIINIPIITSPIKEEPAIARIEQIMPKIIKETIELEKLKEIKKKQTLETFLEEVKSYLKQKNIELVKLESYDKKEVIAQIRFNLTPEKIHLLFAYNRKKIDDKELLKAYKMSIKHQLDYAVLFRGEFSKKLKDTIEAHKKLVSTDNL